MNDKPLETVFQTVLEFVGQYQDPTSFLYGFLTIISILLLKRVVGFSIRGLVLFSYGMGFFGLWVVYVYYVGVPHPPSFWIGVAVAGLFLVFAR